MLSSFSNKIINEYENQSVIKDIKINYKSYLIDLYNNIYNIYLTNKFKKHCCPLNIYIQKNINIGTLDYNTTYSGLSAGLSNNINENIQFFVKDVFRTHFIAPIISNQIKNYLYVSIFTFDYIKIFFYKKNLLSTSDIKDIYDCILRIYILKELYNNNENVKIGIFPTDHKKKFTKNKPIGPINVNSGLCYTNHNIIIIWRKEELKKVIIHELLHAMKLDNELIINENIFNNMMKKNFKISKFIGVNESYTETMACLYNIIFFVISNALDRDMILYYLKIEIFYSIVKTAQILDHYGFKSITDLIEHKTKTINQDSNVFSYYILKCFILYNFLDVLNILQEKKCVSYNNMKLKQECSIIYNDIIKQIYNKQSINYKKLDNMIKKVIQKKYFINNSLRMISIG